MKRLINLTGIPLENLHKLEEVSEDLQRVFEIQVKQAEERLQSEKNFQAEVIAEIDRRTVKTLKAQHV